MVVESRQVKTTKRLCIQAIEDFAEEGKEDAEASAEAE
jgi:hypothetical protein